MCRDNCPRTDGSTGRGARLREKRIQCCYGGLARTDSSCKLLRRCSIDEYRRNERMRETVILRNITASGSRRIIAAIINNYDTRIPSNARTRRVIRARKYPLIEEK